MSDKIERLKEIVKKYYDDYGYAYHIIPTVKYAKILAGKFNADKKIVEIAALLHDIAVNDNDNEHHIIGAERAEKIMRELEYDDNTIERVKGCISTHRTSGEPKNKEAEIIRNADAMAHVAELPFLLKVGLDKTGNLDGAVEWVRKKLKKADKKLTMPEAREIIKEKYDAARLLIGEK